MSAHLRAGDVSRTEDASGAAGAVHSLWSRLFCGPLKMRRVPEEAVLGTEYLFRTVEACFAHQVPLKRTKCTRCTNWSKCILSTINFLQYAIICNMVLDRIQSISFV